MFLSQSKPISLSDNVAATLTQFAKSTCNLQIRGPQGLDCYRKILRPLVCSEAVAADNDNVCVDTVAGKKIRANQKPEPGHNESAQAARCLWKCIRALDVAEPAGCIKILGNAYGLITGLVKQHVFLS